MFVNPFLYTGDIGSAANAINAVLNPGEPSNTFLLDCLIKPKLEDSFSQL